MLNIGGEGVKVLGRLYCGGEWEALTGEGRCRLCICEKVDRMISGVEGYVSKVAPPRPL